MTRNPSEPDGSSKSGASPRANPVCLEVSVTLRSLPGQANSPTQPIREDLKTVIVFENGAVLRSANILPAGMSVILSNSNARDVVCRVVTGRSMPSVKGYVEVEFMEPVKDFWGISQEPVQAPPPSPVAPISVPKLAVPTITFPARPETLKPSLPSSLSAPPARPVFPLPAKPEIAATAKPTPPLRPAPAFNPPPSAGSEAVSGTPEFDEFPTPFSSLGMPASSSKAELKPPAPPAPAFSAGTKAPSIPEKPAMEYSHSDSAAPTSVANWTPPEPETPAAKHVAETTPEPAPAISTGSAPGRDFMSQGLMAYDAPGNSENVAPGRKPLILAAAALVLVGICSVVFFLSRGSGSTPVAKAAIVNSPISQTSPGSNAPAPAAVQTPQRPAVPAPQSEAQPQAQAVAAEPVQPSEAVAPIPSAEIANAANSDSRNARKQDKATASKQAETATLKRPKMANLKMSAPAAPSKNLGDTNDAAPVAEIASANLPAGSTPAALLSSSGRAAGQPVPPSAPAPPTKAATEPKLISSAHAVYPQTAKQANIEGSVTVMASIDQMGKVVSARALNGPVMLRSAAEDAVKQWRYAPALEDGKPVQSQLMVKIDFKLN